VNGDSLWKSDGTEAGTVKIRDFSNGIIESASQPLTVIGGKLYLFADDGQGETLWTSNGTTAGTVALANIAKVTASPNPTELIDVAGRLLFIADDGVHGNELWTATTQSGPSFVKGPDQLLTVKSDLRSIPGWATAISTGTSGRFVVTSDDPGAFSQQPAIDSSGRLNYALKSGFAQPMSVTVNVVLQTGTGNNVQSSLPESFVIDVELTTPWHNAAAGLDVDADSHIVALDALLIINWINAGGAGPVPAGISGPFFYDTNDDALIGSVDALLVINYINGVTAEGEADSMSNFNTAAEQLLTLAMIDDTLAPASRRR
jgi:ELWxxDGT repeat protein